MVGAGARGRRNRIEIENVLKQAGLFLALPLYGYV